MPLIANSLRNLSAALLTAALVVVTLVVGRDIFVPLALACIGCFVMVPVVRLLTRAGAPHNAAVGIVLVVVTGLVIGGSVGLSSQLLSLAAELPKYRVNVLEKVKSVVGGPVPTGVVGRAIDAVEGYQRMLDQELQLDAQATPEPVPQDAKAPVKVVVNDERGGAWAGLRLLAEPLAQVALTFLFTLFLLSQYKDLRDRVVRVVGTENMTETTAAMSDAGDRLSALFTGQALLNAGFGIFVGLVLTIIGVPNAPLWGVVAMVMRWVPFIGSYIAAVPPILLAAAVDPGWTKAICTIAVFAIGEPLMGQGLEPLFLGKRAGLSPFAMVLATSFWTLAWGAIGLVLAAPLTLILVVLGKYVPSLEFVSVLLGDDPPLSKPQEMYHRLLSGDVFGASAQIEEARETSAPETVLDDMVYPALVLASRDRKLGRLSAEDASEFADAISELITVTFKNPESNQPSLLILAARGPVDALTARFAAAAINRKRPDTAASFAEGSGLTALHGITAAQSTHVRQVLLVTVSALSQNLVKHLARKAVERFPDAKVSTLELSPRLHSEDDAKTPTFKRLTDFIATHVRPTDANNVVGLVRP